MTTDARHTPESEWEKYRDAEIVEAIRWNESRETLKKMESLGCRMVRCKGHGGRPDECKDLSIDTCTNVGSARVELGDYVVKRGRRFFVVASDSFAKDYAPCTPTATLADGGLSEAVRLLEECRAMAVECVPYDKGFLSRIDAAISRLKVE